MVKNPNAQMVSNQQITPSSSVQVDSSLSRWLSQRWCGFWRGHHNLMVFNNLPDGVKEQHLSCMWCLHRSVGWEIPKTNLTAYSSSDFEDAIDFMLQQELKLHGGG